MRRAASSPSASMTDRSWHNQDGADSGDELFMKVSARRDLYTALFATGTLVVLVLAYIPIIRAHPGWEDEIYWVSTCLSLLRHKGSIPSVLADFPSPANPLRFYGPTLFWFGTGVLKVFGFSMRTWRSFTFAGNIAYLASIGVLFYRLRRSWAIAMGAVLFCSLSIGMSFGITLPGRPDAWTLALIVLALALVAKQTAEEEPTAATVRRWVGFGALLGLAVSTTPRAWPLLALMVALLPLLVAKHKIRAVTMTVATMLVVWSAILLPLRMTPWDSVASVRHASAGDAVDVSPLMGGSWGFGHATTQTRLLRCAARDPRCGRHFALASNHTVPTLAVGGFTVEHGGDSAAYGTRSQHEHLLGISAGDCRSVRVDRSRRSQGAPPHGLGHRRDFVRLHGCIACCQGAADDDALATAQPHAGGAGCCVQTFHREVWSMVFPGRYFYPA